LSGVRSPTDSGGILIRVKLTGSGIARVKSEGVQIRIEVLVRARVIVLGMG